jgi:preprotein translocase subunit SecY
MISAFANIWKVPELKKRVLFTLGIILLIRVGAAIPLPGIDSGLLQQQLQRPGHRTDPLMDLFGFLTGGALSQAAIFSLGIMPYITASIIMQMMMAVVPALKRLIQEGGESGRQQFIQYTRYLTVAICLGQAFLLARAIAFQPQAIFGGNATDWIGLVRLEPLWQFVAIAVGTMTCGTIFIMWLGEQITERGVGNGASLIIAVGIIDRLPRVGLAAFELFFNPESARQPNPMFLIPMVAMLLLAIAFVVMLTQGVRKIPVQYAKRMVGQKMYGGQATFLPLRVNYVGVMPIIFGQALLLFPFQLLKMADWRPMQKFAALMQPGTILYETSYAILILFFAYFWVSTQFDPVQIADDLKKHGGYIPGIRPGQATADFLDYTMTRITLAGAVALMILAIAPDLLGEKGFGIPRSVASFFGGTSLLIMVGVMLDVMRQIESHLLMRHYDGFLKKGRIRARR